MGSGSSSSSPTTTSLNIVNNTASGNDVQIGNAHPTSNGYSYDSPFANVNSGTSVTQNVVTDGQTALYVYYSGANKYIIGVPTSQWVTLTINADNSSTVTDSSGNTILTMGPNSRQIIVGSQQMWNWLWILIIIIVVILIIYAIVSNARYGHSDYIL